MCAFRPRIRLHAGGCQDVTITQIVSSRQMEHDCISVNKRLSCFRSFLIGGWPIISGTLDNLDWDRSPHFLEEWMQANWELLFEEQVLQPGQLLEPYGQNKSSAARYKKAGFELTHRLLCRKYCSCAKSYHFICFISNKDGSLVIDAPFDCVTVQDTRTGAISTEPFDQFEFYLNRIRDD